MLNPKIQIELNKQLNREGEASQIYLAMSSWAEYQGFEGVCEFLYTHSDEERIHMLKLVRYINERGGQAIITALPLPKDTYISLKELFESLFEHEKKVSEEINLLVDLTLRERDYSTHNFLQWYVAEQIEEERLAKLILDKLDLIGEDKGGLYLFDRDIQNFHGKDDTKT
ncbi:MAG: ferritin [Flavobacteriales bacterium]